MKNNKLYFFIQHELAKLNAASSSLLKDRFQFISNKEGRHYAVYELTVDSRKTLVSPSGEGYRLNSHHVSFDEKQDDKDSNLSQYHYTAYLTGKKGMEHQLHVYFDLNDHPLAVSISVKDANGQYIKSEISPEFSDSLTQLALDKSNGLMKELRKQHLNTLDKLETDYNELERNLAILSKDLVVNRLEYQALYKKALAVLMLLERFHYDPHYEKLVHFFRKISNTIESVPTGYKLEISDVSHPLEHSEETTFIQSSEKVMRKTPKQLLQPLIQEAIEANGRLATSTSLEQQRNDILDARQKTADLLILTEDSNYSATAKDLQQILSLRTENNNKAKRLLLSLLMKKEINLAEPLGFVANTIPGKWIQLALSTGNATMLDFLLTHGHFPINTFQTTDNLSPVEFCFRKGGAKVECLSVLIKHKASIMTKAEDGLPIAHHLIANINGPLHRALSDNTKTTIAQPRFYKTLIGILESTLAQSNVNNSTKAQINRGILNYMLAIKNLAASNNSPIEVQGIQRKMNAIHHITSHPGMNGYIDKLKNDPEVLLKVNNYNCLVTEYNLKISKNTRQQLMRDSNSILKNIDTMFNGVDLSCFSEYKKSTLEFIDDQIHAVRLGSELIDVQKELNKYTRNAHKNPSKSTKQAANRQRELLSELNEINSKYSFLSSSKQDMNSLCENELESIVDKVIRGLKEFSGQFTVSLEGDTVCITRHPVQDISQKLNLASEETTVVLAQSPSRSSLLLTQVISKSLVDPKPITPRLLAEHSLFSQYLRYEASKMRVALEQKDSATNYALIPYRSR